MVQERIPISQPKPCVKSGGLKVIEEVLVDKLGKRAMLHIENYGAGIEERLAGAHETQSWEQFSWGVSDRGASIRIPWQVNVDGKGYLEDRRPNANCDPYVVCRLMINPFVDLDSNEASIHHLPFQGMRDMRHGHLT